MCTIKSLSGGRFFIIEAAEDVNSKARENTGESLLSKSFFVPPQQKLLFKNKKGLFGCREYLIASLIKDCLLNHEILATH